MSTDENDVTEIKSIISLLTATLCLREGNLSDEEYEKIIEDTLNEMGDLPDSFVEISLVLSQVIADHFKKYSEFEESKKMLVSFNNQCYLNNESKLFSLSVVTIDYIISEVNDKVTSDNEIIYYYELERFFIDYLHVTGEYLIYLKLLLELYLDCLQSIANNLSEPVGDILSGLGTKAANLEFKQK